MQIFHLELKNVSKDVSRKVDNKRLRTRILSGLNLSVQQGELVTIMGASGSGKSTLLRLINRLSETDSGKIMFKGKDIREYPPQELRRKIGMVFQFPVMFQGTVKDNISFGMNLWGDPIDINSLARETGIPVNLIGADASSLSGGEKQRVSIARALANQPEILLLDEPTSSLDAGSERKIEELLKRLQKEQNLTMLWVTHEIEQAKRISGKNLLLREGKLEEENG